MPAQNVLKEASKLLIAHFQKRGQAIKTTTSYQLIAAAYGFWSHESVKGYDLPFERYNDRVLLSAKPIFHLDLLTERFGKLLGVDRHEAAEAAQFITELFTHFMPLRIQSLRVMYDPIFSAQKEMIFKIMSPAAPAKPTLASAAITNRLLPALPTSTVEEHLQAMLSTKIDYKTRTATVAELVESTPTWYWAYPNAGFAGAARSLDDVANHGSTEADNWVSMGIKDRHLVGGTRIGVGFVLLQKVEPWREFTDPREPESYRVFTGNYEHTSGIAKGKWSPLRVEVTKRQLDKSSMRQPSVPELLGHPVSELPQLKRCSSCGGFGADAYDGEVALRCSCS